MMVGRAVDHIFPEREAADRRAGADASPACRIRPNSTTSASSCARARSSASTAWSAPAAARSCRRSSASPGPAGGTITLDGKPIAPSSAADAIEAGIVYVPEERGKQGVVIGMPIFQNVSLPSLAAHLEIRRAAAGRRVRAGPRLHRAARPARRPRSARMSARCRAATSRRWSSPNGWRRRRRSSSSTSRPRASTSAPRPPCTASWPSSSPQGLSVIMVSSELPEILGMSDRVVVMREGRIAAHLRQQGARRRRRWCQAGSGDRGMTDARSRTARSGWSLAIAVLIALVSTRFPGFARPGNLATVFNDTSILIILALGQMAVILTRSIDLSMAANLALHRHGRGDDQRRLSRRCRSRC